MTILAWVGVAAVSMFVLVLAVSLALGVYTAAQARRFYRQEDDGEPLLRVIPGGKR